MSRELLDAARTGNGGPGQATRRLLGGSPGRRPLTSIAVPVDTSHAAKLRGTVPF